MRWDVKQSPEDWQKRVKVKFAFFLKIISLPRRAVWIWLEKYEIHEHWSALFNTWIEEYKCFLSETYTEKQ